MKCRQCGREVDSKSKFCTGCGLEVNNSSSYNNNRNDKKSFRFMVILYFVLAFGMTIYTVYSKFKTNVNHLDEADECMFSCAPQNYSYNYIDKKCTCVDIVDDENNDDSDNIGNDGNNYHDSDNIGDDNSNNNCDLLCGTNDYYINKDGDCFCSEGRKVYSDAELVYSDDIEYEYEDNFIRWSKDVKNNETVVTVIGSSYCHYCVKYQPVMHSLYKKYNFKMYFFHVDKMSDYEEEKVSSYSPLESFGYPHTFILKDGNAIDYLEGSVSEDELEDFLRENNIIN